MITRQKKRNRRNQLIIPILALIIFGYFGTQVFQGDYGIRSQENLRETTAELKGELSALTKKRKMLEKRVVLLRDGSIEKDMLDEQVRRSLAYVDENDVVILW